MNRDMEKLYEYTQKWHQPVNVKKTEYVIFHRAVQTPAMTIKYDEEDIMKKTSYRYLGYRLEARLSFQQMLNEQMVKLQRAYSILKVIHQKFPSFFQLKQKFYNTYTWSHLFSMATVYCTLSLTAKNRLNGFRRKCQRLIFSLYQCSTENLHNVFKIPTLEGRYKQSLRSRLKRIQRYEPKWITCYLLRENVANIVSEHYTKKAIIKCLPKGDQTRK